jgi:ferredoxin
MLAISYIKERNDMAYKINDDCTNCAACVTECPVDAISETDGKYVIDEATCADCGACVGVCPVDAIVPA